MKSLLRKCMVVMTALSVIVCSLLASAEDSTSLYPVPLTPAVPNKAIAWVVRDIFLWSAFSPGYDWFTNYVAWLTTQPNIAPSDPNFSSWPNSGFGGDAAAMWFRAKACNDGKPAWMICTFDRVWDRGRSGENFQGIYPFYYSAPIYYSPGYYSYYVYGGYAIYRPGADTGIFVQCTGYCDFIN